MPIPRPPSGFTADYEGYHLTVRFPEDILKRSPLRNRPPAGRAAQDPRPSYQEDPHTGLWHGLRGT